VPEKFYPDGLAIIGAPSNPLVEDTAVGIAFALPVGTEILAPFDASSGGDTSAGRIIILEYGEEVNFVLIGDGLEFTEGSVQRGDVIAVVASEDGLNQSGMSITTWAFGGHLVRGADAH